MGRNVKTRMLEPLLSVMTRCRITADHVTIAGVGFAGIMFVLILMGQPVWAIIPLLMGLVCDNLDGSLARYQNNASDRGKFLDMAMDNVVGTILVLALVIVGVITAANAGLFIWFMLGTLLLGGILNHQRVGSNWLFYSRAGILAQLPKNLLQYCVFVLWAIGLFPWVNIAVLVFNVYFAGLTLFYLIKVFTLPPKESPEPES